VRAHIRALIVKKLAVDGEQAAGLIDCGADTILLFAGMIGGDQMFAPILDPFHWTAQPQCAETGEHVLRIELAAHAEATAGMAFM